MAKSKKISNFQQIFEEHPIKSCIGCFLFGVTSTFFIMNYWSDYKIQNISNRYEDKIENLKKLHEQDLLINEIKLKKEENTKYYLNIDPNSKMAKDISKLIENGK